MIRREEARMTPWLKQRFAALRGCAGHEKMVSHDAGDLRRGALADAVASGGATADLDFLLDFSDNVFLTFPEPSGDSFVKFSNFGKTDESSNFER